MTNTQQMLDLLEEFYHTMRVVIAGEAAVTLSDKDLDIVLETLRSQSLWGESNDSTLANIAAGGKSRGAAFVELTKGNAAIERVLMAFFEGKSADVSATSTPAKRGPGRPPKVASDSETE
jgi:hypothetical protein